MNLTFEHINLNVYQLAGLLYHILKEKASESNYQRYHEKPDLQLQPGTYHFKAVELEKRMFDFRQNIIANRFCEID